MSSTATSKNRPPRSLKQRAISRLLIVVLFTTLGLFVISFTSQPPSNLGVVNGRLAKCPDTPNCVSTQSDDPEQRMEPIDYQGTRDEMKQRIQQTITNSFSRARLVAESPDYLHYEFTSLVFRFVDDVEFFLDDESKQVHFRSASRSGYSDLGVNRRRMQSIANRLQP